MIDTARHYSVFDSESFQTPIHVIGLGASGSKIIIELAKLGIAGHLLHGWDYDKIESHNIANQAFGISDIGKFKADACAEIIKRDVGVDIVTHNEKVVDQRLDGIVFLLTDTMASRKEIFENSIDFNPNIPFVIETRMGKDSIRVYSFRPMDEKQKDKWLGSLCGDDGEVELSPCGGTISVGATSSTLAGIALWSFLRHCGNSDREKQASFVEPEFEIILGLNCMMLVT